MYACLAKSEFYAPFLMLVYESDAAGTLSRSLDDILSISDGMLVVRAGHATAAGDECFPHAAMPTGAPGR